jgi:hypothetical protein
VQGVQLGLWSGEIAIDGITLSNPEGFTSPFLFRLQRLELALHPRSLLAPVVRAPRLVIEGARLNLERSGGRANFGPVLENMRRDTGTPAGEPKRFIIDELRITGVTAQAMLAPALQGRDLRAELPPIVLRDVGAAQGGVTLAELSRIILGEVLKQARESAQLPAELRDALDQVRGLEGRAREEAGKAETRAREQAEKAIEEQRERLLEEGRRLFQ